jgi:hypothetical protein
MRLQFRRDTPLLLGCSTQDQHCQQDAQGHGELGDGRGLRRRLELLPENSPKVKR